MMWNYANIMNSGYRYPWAIWGQMMTGLTFFLIPLLLWSLFWKGWALWLAARNGSKGWFITLLVVNTAGILDIVYIFLFAKRKSTRRK